MMNYEVGIIGGGIIGNSIAYQLGKEGIRAAVLESEQLGSKATSAAAGMLGAHSENKKRDIFYEFCRESRDLFPNVSKDLYEITGIHVQLVQEGMYQLAFTESEAMELKSLADREKEFVWHDQKEVLKQEPNLTDDIIGALWIKGDGQVEPKALCQAFSKGARAFGADFYEQTPVYEVNKTGTSYALKTPLGIFNCEKVIVANGVWSGKFFEQLGLRNPMKPVKGECFAIRMDKPLVTKTIFHEHCYIVPKLNGRCIIGATSVVDSWHQEPTVQGISSLMNNAQQLVPSISNQSILEAWSSLRPQTFDGWPIIGEHPEWEGVFFATGHYRNGILLSPITGIVVKDLVLKQNQFSRYLGAFSINRLRTAV
ncbi:glycine oxidase ThiO [Bacillus alveayuensis]|jgi:glycine oxidase|uniref:glycine oxidase n=1 Tax=Aeribacillus alveayuensis TaxID=279215 RepID=A0ABT9VNB3_9BACI|nr:glycine oxidase ThiO [Bacillus alveayuensis]MDQ0162464.1 glycine oxidase [Bacillus alveayuensis]